MVKPVLVISSGFTPPIVGGAKRQRRKEIQVVREDTNQGAEEVFRNDLHKRQPYEYLLFDEFK